jgi:hypothetical protein
MGTGVGSMTRWRLRSRRYAESTGQAAIGGVTYVNRRTVQREQASLIGRQACHTLDARVEPGAV